MQARYLPATAADDSSGWQQTVMAFLAEKERRSGSRRTVEGYARMLRPFLNRVGSPELVTPAVAATIGVRAEVARRRLVTTKMPPSTTRRATAVRMPAPQSGLGTTFGGATRPERSSAPLAYSSSGGVSAIATMSPRKSAIARIPMKGRTRATFHWFTPWSR